MAVTKRSPNVVSVGDRMEVNLYWFTPSYLDYEDLWFPVIVRGVDGPDLAFCRVEADPRSDDPAVDNEWNVPFRALRSIQEHAS
jgi:hypothetical protein